MFTCPKCDETYPEEGFCGSDGQKLVAVTEDSLIGATVGAYRITARIGAGAWGEVYLGVQPEIGGRVAIKVLKHDHSQQPKLVKRFFNEARAVNLIRHENIVNVIDLAQLPDGRMYIIMEFLDGVPLSNHIANAGRLGVSDTCRICSQVLDALTAAHAKAIVHRDLKPENLFITPEGRAKILDFGIAKLRGEDDGSQTGEGALIGTPHFMSPEQAMGQPVDPRSDLYSMGVILYNCLTGVVPFEASSVMELARAHVERPAQPVSARRPDVPAEIDALVLRALAKDPNDRWQSAAAMGMELQRIGQANPGEKTKALQVQSAPMGFDETLAAGADNPPLAPAGREQVDSRKRPRSIVLALAALLLVGVGVGVATLAGGGGGNSRSGTRAEEGPGGSPQTARPISFSAPIEGVAGTSPQYYIFDAMEGQQLTFIVQLPDGSSTSAIRFALQTEDGGDVRWEKSKAVAGGEQFSFTAKEAQSIVVIIESREDAPTPFKIRAVASPGSTGSAPGGLTEESAQRVNFAAPIQGVVAEESSRHYRFLASSGQAYRFEIFTESKEPGVHRASLNVKVQAENGALLGEQAFITYAHVGEGKPSKAALEFVTVEAGPTLLVIESESKDTPVHYKIESTAIGPSTPLSGGLSSKTPEQVSLEAPISGVVDKVQTRFYRFDSKPGQTYELVIHSESMQPGTHRAAMNVVVAANDGTKLAELPIVTYKDSTTSDRDKHAVYFVSVGAQSMFISIANASEESPVRYEMRASPVGPSFPLSGGLTPESAEPVDLRAPVEGVIDAIETRHYRYVAPGAQTTSFTFYTELMHPDAHRANLTFVALAEDGEKIGEGSVSALANITTPELSKKTLAIENTAAGPVLLLLRNASENLPVHYRLVPEVVQTP